jgi:hypothetical protein
MFRSFFLAGFEGSTGYNRHGEWFDQVVATGHDRTVDSDYQELARLGLHAIRECVRWPLIDVGGGKYDFSSLDPFIDSANRHGLEVIWDLFHYGYPKDLDPLSREFGLRFTDYCYEAARYIAARTAAEVCWFTPVNEPSFLAFAGGEKGLFAPHLTGRGRDLKIALCAAAISGIEALWVAAPGCRIVNVDPLCRVVAPPDRPDLEEHAHKFNATWVFEAWDILGGRLMPELGGSPRHLDVIGINYYWTNQWELEAQPLADGTLPPLADDDPRRLSLADLVRSVWERYGHEMIISETAHVGEHRGRWMRDLAGEAEALITEGVPLRGICLYPILGMPEWHTPDIWTPMGLWDPVSHEDPCGDRMICEDMLQALHEARYLEQMIKLRGPVPRRKQPAINPVGPGFKQAVPGGRAY